MSEKIGVAESVTEGHPDKVCDKIAATFLDRAIIASQPSGIRPRVAMEVSVKGNSDTGGSLFLFGEVTLPPGVSLDYAGIAREVIHGIGYTDPSYGFYSGLSNINIDISQQSEDINAGVSKSETGAGDQGFMIAGAVADDGPEFMPLPIMLAHALTNQLTEVYKTSGLPLCPDGKSIVRVLYRDGKPVSVERVTLAASHDPLIQQGQLREELYRRVVEPVLDSFNFGIDPTKQLIVNGAGPFTIFGPMGDAGTTNRKIVVDTFGGSFRFGGGGLNGKDPTKVDLSGILGVRYVAKALVANKIARRVQLEVSYDIAQAQPFRPYGIETIGRRRGLTDKHLQNKIDEILDLSVDGIINGLDLFKPFYADASVGGFFGRSQFPWEQIPSLD